MRPSALEVSRAYQSPQPDAEPHQRGVDRAEFSKEAVEYARRLEASGDRIHSIRHQITQGVYDTPERLEAALDKMVEALQEEKAQATDR